jgi:ribosomal protein S18 acetylase RimI-like enzyme
LEEDNLLKIRRFVQGKDEEAWLSVWNVVYGQRWDLAPMTVDEMVATEKSPDFDAEGRFIAEVDTQSVGIVHAHVDKLREEKKGFVRNFGVIPRFRGQGIEEKLAETALEELKRRGMKVVQSVADGEQEDVIRLWENLGFKLVRKFSLMTRDLTEVQSSLGENMEIVLKPLRRDADEDLKKLNWLDNECFKEHFNWRPSPVERTIYFVREDPFFKQQEWLLRAVRPRACGLHRRGLRRNVQHGEEQEVRLDLGHRRAEASQENRHRDYADAPWNA